MGDAKPTIQRRAVLSFPEPVGDEAVDEYLVPTGRSFSYDDALAAIVMAQRGEARQAAELLATLEALLGPDGSIGFSFNTIDDSYYNRRYVRSGVVAWVGYAFAYYEWVTGDPAFHDAAQRVARYLLTQRVPDGDDPRAGLVKGGRGLWVTSEEFDPEFVLDAAITEHQIDAWFFFDLLADLGHDRDLRAAADSLGEAIERRLWLADEGRFAVGATTEGPIADEALDAYGSWSALFLAARGKAAMARRLLGHVDRRFRLTHGILVGHRPYAGVVGDYAWLDFSEVPLIWVEGSLGVALARARVGDLEEARSLLVSAAQLQCLVGGRSLPASTYGVRDFPAGPGAAPTAWFVIAVGALTGGEGDFPVWGVGGAAATSLRGTPPAPPARASSARACSARACGSDRGSPPPR